MSTITEYFESLKGKSIAVIGMGVSNTPLIRMLLRAGLKVTVCDRSDRSRVEEQAAELESLGAQLHLGERYLDKLYKFDLIFRTPGLRPDTEQLLEATRRGSEVTSEMELFFRLCPCRIIAVTGSDGKTTTTTLIKEFLIEAGYNVYVGGNIGRPLMPDVADMMPEDMVVVELSSFQLMDMKHSADVSVFTNITPNHLDYHHSMQEYTEAKMNIFLHQSEQGRAVFNHDNDITRALAARAPGKAVFFSRRDRMENGVYLRDDAIWLTNEVGNREVLPISDIQIPGTHNIENYMAAIAAVDGIVPDRFIRAVARRFTGVEHRIEFVRELDGVRYYNDSISTSPTRTIACLDSFKERMVLIVGGYDKQIPFTQMGARIPTQVKTLILCGATAPAIREAVENAPTYPGSGLQIVETQTLAQAVEAAHAAAESGDVVALSPGCAAFDQFKNFMERGKVFKQLVNAL